MAIARPSLASLFIQPAPETGNAMGVATAFIVERGPQLYLITNRHVVRGRDNNDNTYLHASHAEPIKLQVHHHSIPIPGSWWRRDVSLYDEGGSPLWLEHPTYRGHVDVVAIPIEHPSDCDIYPHDLWQDGVQLAVGISQPLFIIGFPFGQSGNGRLGVWVQGTIATELDQDWNARPSFLIDSRTRQGQSGSPVIAYHSGGLARTTDGNTTMIGGPMERFMGVYSGCINHQSDLGIVWKASAIAKIVESGVPGDASNVDFPQPPLTG